MSDLVVLENICKEYHVGKANHCNVLKGVNLSIQQGKIYAIVGESGSGKTTLLNIIGKLTEPTSGTYYFNGMDVSQYRDKQAATFRNRDIGFVIQDFALIEDKSVAENLIVPLLFSQCKLRQMEQKVNKMLERLHIQELKNKKVKYLSGGQKQRIAIARALITEPKLILADEPTGSLDRNTANEIMQLFLEVREEQTTIVIVTHSTMVADKCDCMIYLQDGRIKHESEIAMEGCSTPDA